MAQDDSADPNEAGGAGTDERPWPARRTVLAGLCSAGIAAPVLAACGAGPGSEAAVGPDATAPSGTPGAELVPTADVPVGEGTILTERKVVVTQPRKGEFKGFSAVCTHQGCLVSKIADGEISCPCHGSRYSVKDGSVLGGPAPAPLPPVPVAVEKGEVVRG